MMTLISTNLTYVSDPGQNSGFQFRNRSVPDILPDPGSPLLWRYCGYMLLRRYWYLDRGISVTNRNSAGIPVGYCVPILFWHIGIHRNIIYPTNANDRLHSCQKPTSIQPQQTEMEKSVARPIAPLKRQRSLSGLKAASIQSPNLSTLLKFGKARSTRTKFCGMI